jgi:hypothetical protein
MNLEYDEFENTEEGGGGGGSHGVLQVTVPEFICGNWGNPS